MQSILFAFHARKHCCIEYIFIYANNATTAIWSCLYEFYINLFLPVWSLLLSFSLMHFSSIAYNPPNPPPPTPSLSPSQFTSIHQSTTMYFIHCVAVTLINQQLCPKGRIFFFIYYSEALMKPLTLVHSLFLLPPFIMFSLSYSLLLSLPSFFFPQVFQSVSLPSAWSP